MRLVSRFGGNRSKMGMTSGNVVIVVVNHTGSVIIGSFIAEIIKNEFKKFKNSPLAIINVNFLHTLGLSFPSMPSLLLNWLRLW